MSADTNYETLRRVLVEQKPQGWAIEFGVYSGMSLAIIAEHMPVIGLDSFEGLPEDWREGFPKGAFTCMEEGTEHNFLSYGQSNNSMIVPGLFEESVPYLHARGLPPIGLIHIDCDLYSSTVTALSGMRDYMRPGTVIVFDEYTNYDGWEEHESKAWLEFVREHRVIYQTVAEGDQEMAFRISSIGV